jgi:hypothetical protein
MKIFHLYIREKIRTGAIYGPIIYEVATDRSFESVEETFLSRSQADLKKQVETLHMRGETRSLKTIPQQAAVCAELGEFLFKTFFIDPSNILLNYDEYCAMQSPVRIGLHLPDSLYYLPWEILRDPRTPTGNFITLQGSLIRYDLSLEEKDYDPRPLPLKFFFIYSNPANRPISGDTKIKLPQDTDIVFKRIKPATYDKFHKTMGLQWDSRSKRQVQPTGFVFFGHGDVEHTHKIGQLVFVKLGARIGFSYPWLADPRLCNAIQDVLAANKDIRLAFFCACESGWAKVVTEFQNTIVGSLLRGSSLAYIIGAQSPIDHFAGVIFSSSVLSNLKQIPLDLAVSKARVDVRAMSFFEPQLTYSALDWWVPVLYARASSLDLVPRKDDLDLQPPPPVANRIVLGLDVSVNEPIRTRAIVSDVKRRFRQLFGVIADKKSILLDE